MLYEKVFREFDRQKIRYLLVGGVAVNLHGYDRVTGDLDVLLLMTDTNIKKFIKIVKSLGMVPRIPVKIDDFAKKNLRAEWIKEKNMKAFLVYNPENTAEHLDVIIDHPINFASAYKRRQCVKAGGLNISLIGIDDLITMKKFAGREKDMLDAKALIRIKELRNDQEAK